ncbi:hypothetical protein PIB30_040798 [Stylosanthes scabra]|uniref:Uncharacterized protein n=1 Tax=Stylosanthes scabra TaxID=79078 RepID=A0ABU6SG22_9FABA|nr:hypothetical protein [Stylosanthes scabra]
MVYGYAKLLSPSFHLSHMQNVCKPPHILILHSKFLLELGFIPVHVSEFYDLGDDLSLEDWRLKWMTKVKSNGKLVLGYSMARKKSRVSIDLGVQRLKDFKTCLLNRFDRASSRFHIQNFMNCRFHPVFKFNVQNALRIDSSSSESILKRRNLVFKGIKRGQKGYRLGLWQQRTIRSSKCLWGSCFYVGQELTSRLTVAAGGPSASVPATNLGTSH